MANKFLTFILVSIFVGFFCSVITEVHGFKEASIYLNAYALLSFLILGIGAFISSFVYKPSQIKTV